MADWRRGYAANGQPMWVNFDRVQRYRTGEPMEKTTGFILRGYDLVFDYDAPVVEFLVETFHERPTDDFVRLPTYAERSDNPYQTGVATIRLKDIAYVNRLRYETDNEGVQLWERHWFEIHVKGAAPLLTYLHNADWPDNWISPDAWYTQPGSATIDLVPDFSGEIPQPQEGDEKPA